MNKEVIILLATLIFAQVSSQNLPQNQQPYYDNTANRDRVYFSDNRPTYNVEITKTETYEVPNTSSTAQQHNRNAFRPTAPLNTEFTSNINNLNVNVEPLPKTDINRQKSYGNSDFDSGRQRPYGQVPLFTNKNISTAIADFGISVMTILGRAEEGNVVVSPYSIHTLLSLIQQGSFGETQSQITEALSISPDAAGAAYNQINNNMQKRNSRNILNIANNVFVADAFHLNPGFKRIAMRNFASEITPTSFTKSAKAAQRINNWVASRTNNKIMEIVPEEGLSEDSQMVLVNAVYFKGLWEMRFKPDNTVQRQFHLKNGITKQIPFMHNRKFYKAGVDPRNNAKFVIIPFEGNQISLIVIQPSRESSPVDILSSLTGAQLADYHTASPKDTVINLPKFTVRKDINLDPVLRVMGITNLFTSQSELAGIGTYRNLSPEVSSAYHSAMLSIDEEGGSAAAATAFAVVALSNDDPSFVFTANTPFLAVLWDNELSLPLFMARVDDPSL